MRLESHKSWFQGKTPIMICTSAFSTGNDYPNVRLVIHLKTPFEMTEIIQAQGRGGRDGKPSRCYILPSMTPPKIAIGREAEDHKGLWYAQNHIY
jgi:superfamily II DNA helicase RecQ